MLKTVVVNIFTNIDGNEKNLVDEFQVEEDNISSLDDLFEVELYEVVEVKLTEQYSYNFENDSFYMELASKEVAQEISTGELISFQKSVIPHVQGDTKNLMYVR